MFLPGDLIRIDPIIKTGYLSLWGINQDISTNSLIISNCKHSVFLVIKEKDKYGLIGFLYKNQLVWSYNTNFILVL